MKKKYLSTNLKDDGVLNINTTYKLVINSNRNRNGNYDLIDNNVVCEFQNNNELRTIKMNKTDFIEWFYSNREDLQDLGLQAKMSIIKTGEFFLTLENVFNSVGYIPIRLIINADELKDLIDDDEIAESDLQDLKVEWC